MSAYLSGVCIRYCEHLEDLSDTGRYLFFIPCLLSLSSSIKSSLIYSIEDP